MTLRPVRWFVLHTFMCYFPGCGWTGATHQDWSAHLATHY